MRFQAHFLPLKSNSDCLVFRLSPFTPLSDFHPPAETTGARTLGSGDEGRERGSEGAESRLFRRREKGFDAVKGGIVFIFHIATSPIAVV